MESIGNNLSANFAFNQLNQLPSQIGEKQQGKSDDKVGNIISDFGSMLKSQMDELNDLSHQASSAVKTYATGGDIELHNVMLAMEKSGTAMQLAMQVRNKMLSAYQEVMRTQI